MEVVTRSVAKLNIDSPAEKQDAHPKNWTSASCLGVKMRRNMGETVLSSTLQPNSHQLLEHCGAE